MSISIRKISSDEIEDLVPVLKDVIDPKLRNTKSA